jgi:multimeric flavodoxin WrbA
MKLAWKDKIAAGFTNSGSPSGDKLNTLFQLSVLAAQHGMIWVGQTEVNDGKINRIGSFLGLMAQSDNAPADQTPPPQDLETARRFGARVAKAVLRWNK